MCLGDKVKVSEVPGKAEAIRYDKLDLLREVIVIFLI